MKNVYFLLLVIAIVTTATSNVIAQNNIEEHKTIIDRVRIGNTIRFTLEVEKDSALCLPELKKGECYVQSQKYKKYVYIDVSETPLITPIQAEEVYLKDYWVNTDNLYISPGMNTDFPLFEPEIKYSQFPWLKFTMTDVKARYYGYDSKSMKMRKKVTMQTSTQGSTHIHILWIILCVIVIVGIFETLSGKFFDTFGYIDYKDKDPVFFGTFTTISILVAMTTIVVFDQRWVYSAIYGLIPLLSYGFFPKIYRKFVGFKFDKYDKKYFKGPFCFTWAITSILTIIFCFVHLEQMYFKIFTLALTVTLVITFTVILRDSDQKIQTAQ